MYIFKMLGSWNSIDRGCWNSFHSFIWQISERKLLEINFNAGVQSLLSIEFFFIFTIIIFNKWLCNYYSFTGLPRATSLVILYFVKRDIQFNISLWIITFRLPILYNIWIALYSPKIPKENNILKYLCLKCYFISISTHIIIP